MRKSPLIRNIFLLVLVTSRQAWAFWTVQVDADQVQNNSTPVQNIPVEYGVDVSFPIHREVVSTNYAWLPHNLDSSIPIPKKYKGMPVQPLGDRQTAYNEFINGCVQKFAPKGDRCISTEKDRVEMR